ncbi:MAG: tetratricopeptide repeat protein [Chryseobacterium sp.]|jgi:tetratricopeptide (TPR) repeat protein|uniref:tetratricopeptide repeat protein n=1 Tax=Chryseobacterium sp. TaxID=1871047 RepID=UPI00282DBA77|nr:tetratricopeptide repeat protein [Chryseobacterium sp.]MDR2237988.1 tetratricopeptide repeat protein [Chryseobacterium sp.]
MKTIQLFTVLLLLFPLLVFSQSGDNPELQKMADDDQNARKAANIDWSVLSKEDEERRARIMELIKEGKVKTAKDHYNSGIVFQHGNDSVSSGMAVKSFEQALKLDPTLNRWWYAAAVDRDLMRRKQPQIYGTQFIKNKDTNGKWIRYTIDSSKATDEQRKYYGVETLKEQEEKERKMNLIALNEAYNNEKSIDKLIPFIKSEYKKGLHSKYNIDEGEINSFGYQLVQENKMDDALKIFRLNIELYPTAWNTYDSYGEILLQVGKKQEGLENYKKSLELNPDNENAKKVLGK